MTTLSTDELLKEYQKKYRELPPNYQKENWKKYKKPALYKAKVKALPTRKYFA